VKKSQDDIPGIDRKLHIGMTLFGAVVLIVYWRSWSDTTHLVYDIPSALAICAYIAQFILDTPGRQFGPGWRSRAVLLVPMCVIPFGRTFLEWNISGHLTDILAVALIQSVDKNLSPTIKRLYWIPVPIILYIRWFIFDKPGHWEMYNAIIAALLMAGFHYLVLFGFSKRKSPGSESSKP